ncbi:hypothetical protein JM66_12790 [Aeromonas bestiarum]|nr:hypothetical protein JM66_12790 [Aeromonas bestiarum]
MAILIMMLKSSFTNQLWIYVQNLMEFGIFTVREALSSIYLEYLQERIAVFLKIELTILFQS